MLALAGGIPCDWVKGPLVNKGMDCKVNIVVQTINLWIGNVISGPLFTKKTPSYGYTDPHYKPKTV